MATNDDLIKEQWDTKIQKIWHELLPGIEEFLINTLASEKLSSFAEERRQFFIECLDILQLPPTVPPREGRRLSPELLKATEETSGLLVTPDFAATQREISRSLADPNVIPCQEESAEDDNSSQKSAKVYDDIDLMDSVLSGDVTKQTQNSEGDKNDEVDDDDENALYEIPVARLQLSSEENSFAFGAEGSSLVTLGSVEDFSEDNTDSLAPPLPSSPPPLPPRKDFKFSEFGSRISLVSDEKPPELPFRPQLAKRNELYVTHSERSDRSGDRSDQDLSGDGDSTSYESFDEAVDPKDQEFREENNIKLPKKVKKKSGLRKNKKLSKSKSASQWEISVPYRKLENILISGEMYHKGKLSWNRRIVAISNGSLAMYKPDKDARPSLVIALSGYEASVLEKEGRRGYEIKLMHPTQDTHTFSVDFRDWAYLWADHINGVCKGQPLPKYETHLARSLPANSEYGTSANGHLGSKENEASKNVDDIDLDYDEVGPCALDLEDLFIDEEGDSESTCSNPSQTGSEQPLRAKILSRHFCSEKSSLFKSKTLDSRSRNHSGSYKEKSISSTVKDILKRRQKGMYQIQGKQLTEPTLQESSPTILTKIQERQFIPQGQQLAQPRSTTLQAAASLSLARWDWKSVFYNWSLPLDQIILALRGSDLASSNSNLSTGSEGTSEDSTKTRLRGNKVMRMGSFAFRATQFFENISKKTSKPRKSSSNMASASSGDYSDLQNGIVEESSVSSLTSFGNLSPTALTPTSDLSLPNVFSDSPSPTTPFDKRYTLSFDKEWEIQQEDIFANVDHKGFLYIFSTFNRRKWGKRWCLVRENMFECYRTDHSKQCELSFLLRPCTIRRAMVETNSELGLMILESGKEKITIEPVSKEDMGPWVQVLLSQSSTQEVPEGLEQYMQQFKTKDGDSNSLLSLTVLKQWELIPNKDTSLSHEYEDPLDVTLTAKQLYAASCADTSGSEPLSESSSSADVLLGSADLPDTDNGDSKSSDVSIDAASCSNETKHTTDSGFYSVKGNNSDSDSGCDNCAREVEELDSGCAKLDSQKFTSSHLSTAANASVNNKTDFSDFSEKLSGHMDINQNESVVQCNIPVSDSMSSVHSSSSSIEHSTSLKTQSSYNKISNITTDRKSSSPSPEPCFKKPSALSQLLHQPALDTFVTSSGSILSPSGDEYSIVIKRSVKSKSKSPEPSNLSSKIQDSVTSAQDLGNEEDSPKPPALPLALSLEPEKSEPSQERLHPPIKSKPISNSSNLGNNNAVFKEQGIGKIRDKTPTQQKNKSGNKISPIKASNTDTSTPLKNSSTSPKIFSPDDVSKVGESPASPKLENIADLIDNPTTTTDDLKAAIDRLKTKLSNLKKKRMAVHEKRNKVLTDEERLICEKELAALEKDTGNTDLDIRVLLNHLDTLQGQSLEAIKAVHGRQKNSVKKKKNKRKV